MNIDNVPHFSSDKRPNQYLKLLREDKAFVSLVESVISFPQKLQKYQFNNYIIVIFKMIITCWEVRIIFT
jgi:uncharacterized membrane protein